jgi:hypothetical protein
MATIVLGMVTRFMVFLLLVVPIVARPSDMAQGFGKDKLKLISKKCLDKVVDLAYSLKFGPRAAQPKANPQLEG